MGPPGSPSGVCRWGRNGPMPIMSRSSSANIPKSRARSGAVGNTDHDTAAGFVAQLPRLAQQRDAIAGFAWTRWMNAGVQFRIPGLEAQQVTVGAASATGETFRPPLTQAQRHRQGVSRLMVRMMSATHSAAMPKSSPDCITTVPKGSLRGLAACWFRARHAVARRAARRPRRPQCAHPRPE